MSLHLHKHLKSALVAITIVFCIELAFIVGGRLLTPSFLETLHKQKEHRYSYIEIDTISEPIGRNDNHLFYLVSDHHYMYVVKSSTPLTINTKVYGYSRTFDPYLKQLTIESLNTIAETQIVTPESFNEVVGLYYLDTTTSPYIMLGITGGMVLLLGLIYFKKR